MKIEDQLNSVKDPVLVTEDAKLSLSEIQAGCSSGYPDSLDRHRFDDYDHFCAWVYDPSTRNPDMTWPRLECTFDFVLETDTTLIYSDVMQCLHAHEEG